jgi:hypothetical protein
MLRATHRPSSGAQNCNCSLWFYIRLWLPVAAAMAELSSASNFGRMLEYKYKPILLKGGLMQKHITTK